jgi:hypothetical protein
MRISPYAKLPIVMHLEGTICAVELRVGRRLEREGRAASLRKRIVRFEAALFHFTNGVWFT